MTGRENMLFEIVFVIAKCTSTDSDYPAGFVVVWVY